jgi:CRP/FNR family transcriptional regulator, cyclic AMP receptor protein
MTKKEALKDCRVFLGLNDGELDQVVGSAIEKQYEAGDVIFREGQNADELVVLQEGRVALQMTLPKVEGQLGHRITVDIVNKNEIVGWSTVVEPYVYTFSAVCLQKVNVLSINGTKLKVILREHPEIGYKVVTELIKVVASRLHDTTRVLVSERILTNVG